MVNILGEKLLDAANHFSKEKHKYDSFDIFFAEYINSKIIITDEIASLISDFIVKTLDNINNNTTNEEIESKLNDFKNVLISKNALINDIDISEVIGYILLGNVLHN